MIIEGILLFQFDEIIEHLNMKIFVDTDADVRLARRIQVRYKTLRLRLRCMPLHGILLGVR